MHQAGSATVAAIDIGNTNTHLGVVDTSAMRCLHRFDFPSTAVSADPSFIVSAANDSVRGIPWVIAGGRNGLAFSLEQTLHALGIATIVQVHHHTRLPVRFHYDNPSSLGADRIAHALFVHRRYPGRTVIVISSGTAITIDVIKESGEFMGGVIMAGIPAQLLGLHAAAPALPLPGIPELPVTLPARSTAACMHAGIVHGTAGALNHIVGRYRAELAGEPIILASGGGWKYTEHLLDFKYSFEPDLTIVGAALYALYP
jgi:type III pantothenate kinase